MLPCLFRSAGRVRPCPRLMCSIKRTRVESDISWPSCSTCPDRARDRGCGRWICSTDLFSPWPFCIENYPSDQRLSHETYSQTFIYLCALSKQPEDQLSREKVAIFSRVQNAYQHERKREKAITFPPSFLDFTSTSSGRAAHCQGLLRNMFLVVSQVSAASAGGGGVGVNVFPPPRSSILFASFPPAVSSFAASTWCVPGGGSARWPDPWACALIEGRNIEDTQRERPTGGRPKSPQKKRRKKHSSSWARNGHVTRSNLPIPFFSPLAALKKRYFLSFLSPPEEAEDGRGTNSAQFPGGSKETGREKQARDLRGETM